MANRHKVLLVIPHLGGGGAERVIANLARGLDQDHFVVHLCIIAPHDASGHTFPSSVFIHALGARRVRSGARNLLRLIWSLKPAVILAGMAHLNLLVLLLKPFLPRPSRIIVRQNGSLAGCKHLRWFRVLYPKADAIVCQTAAMAAEVSTSLKTYNAHVLPNPVDVIQIRRRPLSSPRLWEGPGPHLLAVGRLSHEKGFDLLLSAFSAFRSLFPSSDLVILGEGRERPSLERLAHILGLRDAVRMPGYVQEPAIWFLGATLFVLPSREECMPNALLEAAAGGLPLVTTRASAGLVDLLHDRKGVWVAPSISSQAIEATMREAIHALEPGERFPHEWVETFGLERAVTAYQALIEKLAVSSS